MLLAMRSICSRTTRRAVMTIVHTVNAKGCDPKVSRSRVCVCQV